MFSLPAKVRLTFFLSPKSKIVPFERFQINPPILKEVQEYYQKLSNLAFFSEFRRMENSSGGKTIKVISVLGCGWVGLPLLRDLKQMYIVKASASTKEKSQSLRNEGFDNYLLQFNEQFNKENAQAFLNCDVLIITLPPVILQEALRFLPEIIESQTNKLKVIYLSSTSVYARDSALYQEKDAVNRISNHSGLELLALENEVQKFSVNATTILRLAGLIGYDRQPGKFHARNTAISDPDAPVNLVHRDDVISIIFKLILRDKFGTVYNVCAPMHPNRKDFYSLAAELLGLKTPKFSENTGKKRIISSEKLIAELDYEYLFPDPIFAVDDITDEA